MGGTKGKKALGDAHPYLAPFCLDWCIIAAMDYLLVLFWSLIGSVFSLVGGILLVKTSKKRQIFVRYALPFGAGAMLAAAFLGLLPEALEGQAVHSAVLWVLLGFLIFFVLKRGLGWFHHHHHHHDVHGAKDKTHTSLVIVGDTLHNAIDGVALGAAFLINPAAGIGTALAIAFHEIPQEIGDFGILLAKGMKAKKVILFNILSALATVVMALVTFWLGGAIDLNVAPLLALAAGFFIYIAAADIIPDIHERPYKEAPAQVALLLIGVAVIGGVLLASPHDHGHDEHDHQSHLESRPK